MQRRVFLKLLGFAGIGSAVPLQAFAGVLNAASPWNPAVAYDNRFYRVGGDGQILVSNDFGKTWQLHANFGPTCDVMRLSARGGRLTASASYQGLGFPLYLGADRRQWLTV